eukprot:1363702-Rhodomonas_salina.1
MRCDCGPPTRMHTGSSKVGKLRLQGTGHGTWCNVWIHCEIKYKNPHSSAICGLDRERFEVTVMLQLLKRCEHEPRTASEASVTGGPLRWAAPGICYVRLRCTASLWAESAALAGARVRALRVKTANSKLKATLCSGCFCVAVPELRDWVFPNPEVVSGHLVCNGGEAATPRRGGGIEE